MEDNIHQTQISSSMESGSNSETSVIDRLSGSLHSLSELDVSDEAANLIEKYIAPSMGGLMALLAAYFVAKFLSRQVSRVVCKRVDETLGIFIGKIVFYGLMILAITVVLPTVGIEVSGLMAVLATAGFAIGLAFQGTLSNFSAGVLLLVFRPFKVGDLVNIAGILGKVSEIDIFTTKLDTPDNRRLIIPNSSIAGNTIENLTFHQHRRVEVVVGVEYSASLDRTREALTACAESMADCTIQGEGRGYQVILTNLADSTVQWTVRLWVAKDQFFACRERLTGEIKRFLGQYGVGIAYPQLRIHLDPSPGVQGPVLGQALHSLRPMSGTVDTKAVEYAIRNDSMTGVPPASLSIPNIHPAEDRRSRIRPRVRGDSME